MRLLVTGWDGLLGSSLVPKLRNTHPVAGFGIDDGDVTDVAFVEQQMRTHRPDLVLHLAAMTAVDACEADPDRAFAVNEQGTRTVARAAQAVGARVITLSTDYAFNGTAREPYPEDAEPQPLSVYGQSKVAGERALAEECVSWAVVRSAWLFGRGGGNFVDTILDRLAGGNTLDVVSDQTGSPTYTPHLVEGLRSLVERGGQGVYHMVSAGEATWCDLARAAAEEAGLDPVRVRAATTEQVGRPAPRPVYSVLGTERAARELAFDPPHWREGIRDHVIRRGNAPGKETGS